MYRTTLMENVPCLNSLSCLTRKDCLSGSNHESSFQESIISQQSSSSRATFCPVFTMSTGNMGCSDVELDPLDSQPQSFRSTMSYSLSQDRDHGQFSHLDKTESCSAIIEEKGGRGRQEAGHGVGRGFVPPCIVIISPSSESSLMEDDIHATGEKLGLLPREAANLLLGLKSSNCSAELLESVEKFLP
ncbi:hypothetical protein SKAU_G00018290 [Synaphobranchus kaupii]|uniref:Uncharacterized protein n=1 Tax=Synaphobranchus kaupii TaxID=118154 RepID=A0A9Q1GCL8_SYNKA|nr:hypothetical protein SKAU_G00018290 [Synaphobranchus kaupii]